MPDIAIRVDNLSKLYHLGAVHHRPDTTSTVLCAAPRRGNTRLKILSRITEPISGLRFAQTVGLQYAWS